MNGTTSTAEADASLQRQLESLTPEQRDALRAYAADYVARRSRVVVDGKVSRGGSADPSTHWPLWLV